MKISTISARGLAGLPDLDVDLGGGGAPLPLLFVTGPAASGKTHLLDAIVATFEAVAPYEGLVRALDWVPNASAAARIELGLWLDGPERTLAGGTTNIAVSFESGRVVPEGAPGLSKFLQRYNHDDNTGKREYFPETRQLWWGPHADGLGTLEQSLLRCSKTPSKYSFVPRFLAALPDDPVRSARFTAAISRVAPWLEYLPTNRERCFSSRGGPPVPPSSLSSSEADAVLICATAAMIGLSHSIVLLDRPELYVPPNRIVAFAQALATLGTDNQWIVATNSPELLQSVPRTQIVSLATDARGSGRSS
ncbi:MAG TPA: hypothetical protein PK156_03695 [Polyangium sp.]|nr:hypothetical protein [Polyangium sp.]